MAKAFDRGLPEFEFLDFLGSCGKRGRAWRLPYQCDP
jgi:hypothetical protein